MILAGGVSGIVAIDDIPHDIVDNFAAGERMRRWGVGTVIADEVDTDFELV